MRSTLVRFGRAIKPRTPNSLQIKLPLDNKY
jgi:hypothetical protein